MMNRMTIINLDTGDRTTTLWMEEDVTSGELFDSLTNNVYDAMGIDLTVNNKDRDYITKNGEFDGYWMDSDGHEYHITLDLYEDYMDIERAA